MLTLIPGPSGPLEADLNPAPVPESGRALVIICHPHPLHGGTMQNKVVTTLQSAFKELNCVTARFNFRGVGRSEGVFDHGLGEGDDLRAVAQYLRTDWEHAADCQGLPLWLAGFSFGSFVAASRAEVMHAQRLLSVAPPVASEGYFRDFISLNPQLPWDIVQGDQDEIVSAEAVYDFAAKRPQVRLHRLQATHFFHGVLLELRQTVSVAFQ